MLKFAHINDGYIVAELDISMQMWLDLYVTPDLGDPSTWEDENKKYSRKKEGWMELTEVAEHRAQVLLQDVEKSRQYEDDGLTYREVTLRTTGRETSMDITNNKYDASEDLMYLYSQISRLYEFIFDVRNCL